MERLTDSGGDPEEDDPAIVVLDLMLYGCAVVV